MTSVFADANYWIALLNPLDDLRSNVESLSPKLKGVRIVTSEMVLVEVLNGLAGKGPKLRQAAIRLVEELRKNANVTVVPQTREQFQNGLDFYRKLDDKAWGLTDCASILIIREHGIQDVLTYDEHFQQAGFTALLRDGK